MLLWVLWGCWTKSVRHVREGRRSSCKKEAGLLSKCSLVWQKLSQEKRINQQLWSRKKRQLQDRKRLLRMQVAKILRKLFMNVFTWRYLKNISRLRWLFSWLGQEEEASARKKQVGFGNAHVIMLVFACESHMHVSACPRVSMHDSTYLKQSLQSWISLWGGRSSCQEEAGAQGDNACKIT